MTDSTEVARVDNPFRREQDGRQSTALTEAVSSREVAEVQAALVVARKFPRDRAGCMDLILTDCTLPALAEAATYDYKRGGSAIGGPTIRLAEAVARRWGNMQCGVKELSRSVGQSECMAYAWDLESGYREERVFQVPHWRDTRDGGHPLTDERDIYELIANMGARRKRACILALIPLDVVESAVQQCEVTMRAKIKITDEYLSMLLEKLGEFHITKEMVEKRLQRRYAVDTVTPAMGLQLQKIYNSLFDKASVVADWFKADREKVSVETTESGRKKPKPKPKDAPKSDAKPPQAEPPVGEPEALTKLADASQLEFIRNKAKAGEIGEHEICKAFKLEKLEELRAAVVSAVLKWLSDPTSVPGV